MNGVKLIRDVFLTNTFFLVWGMVALIFIVAYFIPVFMILAQVSFCMISLLTLLDVGILFFTKNAVSSERFVNDLLSNAEENEVRIKINSTYSIPLFASIIDELPYQFQQRDFLIAKKLEPLSFTEINYTVCPHIRGEYRFEDIHVYVSSKLKLIQRRFTSIQGTTVKVYPAFTQLKKFQLKSIPEMQESSYGRTLLRKGMSTEFDHIKEYNRGDDARTINWKASARRDQLMINSFMDEKSQQIYCVIDKGRTMKMPFDNLSLLDYSLNAALMFTYVALQKDDKVGVITFGEKVSDFLQASKSKKQFNVVMETLFKLETRFLESNYEDLFNQVNKRAGQRSLLLLFTNFETLPGFERQLPYLKMLNKKHVLVVILFENTELTTLHQREIDTLEDLYITTIADQTMYEKKMIMKELIKNGILSIYTPPSQLTVSVVNKYLELKSRQMI